MNTVTVSFNNIMGQVFKMFQWPKCPSEKKQSKSSGHHT